MINSSKCIEVIERKVIPDIRRAFPRGRSMGARKFFFQGGPLLDFYKNFCRGFKSGEICFFPLETKKTTFFAEIFKIQGALGPPSPPSDAHG